MDLESTREQLLKHRENIIAKMNNVDLLYSMDAKECQQLLYDVAM
jgi:hypothetical protein